MIFTALGLLVVAGGLLVAGIAKSSVALLMTSLVLTVASGAVLAMVLPATRKLAASSGGGTAPAFTTPRGQPVVLYVQQAPTATAPQPAIDLTRSPASDAQADGSTPFIGYDLL